MSQHGLHELTELEHLLDGAGSVFDTNVECVVDASGQRMPVYCSTLGSKDMSAPVVGFFGGIHGLEKIGTRVLLAFMHNLIMRLRWDRVLAGQLEQVRLVFMPLVNPGGMIQGTRCNPRGVDLMRNAPIESRENVAFMIGGQRYSSRLPWYRGNAGEPMEIENQAVARVVQREMTDRPFSLALDCHSGFGMRDRIWFPWAHTRRPFHHLAEVYALKDLFDDSYPHHAYVFEPQCHQYLTHGDLWDYLSTKARETSSCVFLPLTLELGSWLWVRKNPRQLFSRAGMFNPLVPHREQRVLRGHLLWMDFLTRAASAWNLWVPDARTRDVQHHPAHRHWYEPS